ETDIRQKDEKRSQNDKTEHGMEEREKVKVKVKPEKSKSKPKPNFFESFGIRILYIIIIPKKVVINEKANENEEEGNDSPENTHVNPSPPPDPSVAFITEKVLKFNSFFESLGLVPQSSDTEVVCTKGDDEEVMFIELIRKNDDSSEGEPEEEGSTTTEGVGAEYFDIFPTRSELAYHKKLDPMENSNRGVSNFIGRIKGMHVFIGNFTYIIDFMIVEDISSIIDPRNEEDKRRGVEYVMSKILGFYKECLELGPEYVTGMDDEEEVT
ncbi:hypothetical protein Tco_0428977, partial [Tanacetum coccineum]